MQTILWPPPATIYRTYRRDVVEVPIHSFAVHQLTDGDEAFSMRPMLSLFPMLLWFPIRFVGMYLISYSRLGRTLN